MTKIRLARGQTVNACRVISAAVGAYLLVHPEVIKTQKANEAEITQLIQNSEKRFIQFRNTSTDVNCSMGLHFEQAQPIFNDSSWLDGTSMEGASFSLQGEGAILFKDEVQLVGIGKNAPLYADGHQTETEAVFAHLNQNYDNTVVQITIGMHSTTIGRTGDTYWHFDSLGSHGATVTTYTPLEMEDFIRARESRADFSFLTLTTPPALKAKPAVIVLAPAPVAVSVPVEPEESMIHIYKNFNTEDADVHADVYKEEATNDPVDRDQLLAYYYQALINKNTSQSDNELLNEASLQLEKRLSI